MKISLNKYIYTQTFVMGVVAHILGRWQKSAGLFAARVGNSSITSSAFSEFLSV